LTQWHKRLAETNLLRLANSPAGRSGDFQFGGEPGRFGSGLGTRGGASNRLAGVVRRGGDDSDGPSNSVRSAAGPGARGGFRGRPGGIGRSLSFLAKEKSRSRHLSEFPG